MGGYSSEVNISLKSGNVVYNHLDKNKRPPGFGQFFLLKKKNWPKLPDNLKSIPISKPGSRFIK